jgi:DNA ligase-1
MVTIFVEFLEVCERLEEVKATSSKNRKVEILASMLKKMRPEEVREFIRYSAESDVGVGWATIRDAALEVAARVEGFSRLVVEKGDLGEAVFEMLKGGKGLMPLAAGKLTLMEVMETFSKMRGLKGQGSSLHKKRSLIGLMLRADPLEAKYIVKFLTGELRIGATLGLLEEAVALAFGKPKERIREAVLMLADLSKVAYLACIDRLEEARPSLYSPIGFMLAETSPSAEDAMEHFGKEVALEFKYDGVRAQAHTGVEGVRIFSRRLEDVTESFPELVEDLSSLGVNAVFDGEVVAFSDGRPLHFKKLQQRLHRKHIDEDVMRDVPVHYFIFDLLIYEGRVLFNLPLKERRRMLESLELRGRVHLAPQFYAVRAEEVAKLFERSRELGYEGLMIKDPASPYTPGRRGGNWMKLKKELDTIDAVVVAVEYGHGKRAGLLSDYTFAVWDDGELKVIGKAYSGLTDEEIEEMTEYFKQRVVEWRGAMAVVKPEVVVEVAFDSVQRSGRHSSGFALRFPRIKRIRWDKRPEDADTLRRVMMIYEKGQLA